MLLNLSKGLTKGLRIPALGLLIACGLFLLLALVPYPELEAFRRGPYSITLTDRNGLFLRELPLAEGLRREFTPLEEVPVLVRQIFIKSEDSRFYFHPGVDPLSIVRALWQNRTARSTVSGASTITMQLAAMIIPRENSYRGKLLEMYDALRLEARLSKKEILELYLNAVPFGSNARGIGSGGYAFFGSAPDRLSLAQALVLAVVPRRPGKYNPRSNPGEAARAAAQLARRLGLALTAPEIEQAIGQIPGYEREFNAPHFSEFVKNRPELPTQAAARDYRVQTSLDLDLNRNIEQLLETLLYNHVENRLSNGAVLVLDNLSGEIMAYVGSRDFFDELYAGQIDGVQVTNQPGSTLKPFLYALALEQGYGPQEILPDIPSDFGTEQVYVPMNYNRRFNGPVRLRVALASSLNVPAVFLVSQLGTRQFVHTLTELGFDSLRGKEETIGSTIALGGEAVSLFELTRAFSIFPRGGQKLDVTYLKKKDKPRKEQGDPGAENFFSPYTAYTICSILSDAASRVPGFGEARIFRTPFPAIFKTGTSNQFNNIWALGATPRYTVGVWMGNFGGETVIAKTGSSLPAQVVVQVLEKLSRSEPGGDFPLPPGAERLGICTLSGKKPHRYCPAVLYEYIKSGTDLPECDYHRFEGGRVEVHYPALFAGWVRGYQEDRGTFFYDETAAYPQILKPNRDSVFYFDPSIRKEDQAVRVEVLHNEPQGELQIYHNGFFYRTLDYPYIFFFPLEQGEHVLEVQGPAGSDRVSFTVR